MISPSEVPAPSAAQNSSPAEALPLPGSPLRKFIASLPPGRTEYKIVHNLETEDVIVQTRIAGRIREGGISIVDANVVLLTFGGVLNEQIDLVIIG